MSDFTITETPSPPTIVEVPGQGPQGPPGTVAPVSAAVALAIGPVALAGATGTVSDAGHVHPDTGLGVLATARTWTAQQTMRQILAQSSAIGTTAVIVKAFAGQTADLLQYQDSAGNPLTHIDPLGNIGVNMAPNVAAGNAGSRYLTLIGDGVGGTNRGGRLELGSARANGSLAVGDEAGRIIWYMLNQNGGIGVGGTLSLVQTEIEGTGGVNGFGARIRFQTKGDNGITPVEVLRLDSSQRVGIAVSSPQASLHVSASGGTNRVQSIIQGVATQAADLTQWQNSSSVVIASVTPGGTFTAGAVNAGTSFPGSWQGARLVAWSQATSDVVSIFRGFSGQSADLAQWQNSGNTPLAKMSAAGALWTAGVAASSDSASFTNAGQVEARKTAAQFWGQGTAGTWGGGGVAPAAAVVITNTNPSGYDPVLLFRMATSASVIKSVGAIDFIGTSSWTDGTVGTQTADMLFIVRDAADTLVERFRIGSNGTTTLSGRAAGQAQERLQVTDGVGGTVLVRIDGSGKFAVNTSPSGFTTPPMLSTQSSGATTPGLYIQGAGSQSADLQDWLNSSGTVLSSISSSGAAILAGLQVTGGNFRVDSAGRVGLAGAANTTALVWASAAHPGSASSSYGFVMEPVHPATATTRAVNNYSFLQTAAGAYTVPAAYDYWADGPGTLGAGSAVTTAIGFKAGNHGVTGVSNAYGAWIDPQSGASNFNVGLRVDSAAAGAVWIAGDVNTTGNPGAITWGTGRDTNLYRNGAGVLRTDGSLVVIGLLGAGPNGIPAADVSAQISPPTVSGKGLMVRGLASQSGNLQQWQNSAGVVLTSVDAAGSVAVGGGITLRAESGPGSGLQATFQATTTGTIALVAKGAASQTADLQQWQLSNGAAVALITANGELTLRPANGGAAPTTATLFAEARTNSLPIIITRGGASQSASMQEWQNSSGTKLAGVDSLGNLTAASASWLVAVENSGAVQTITKSTAAAANPGAGLLKLYVRDGTNASTLKLVVRAGAAGAETTVLDNIPT